MDKMRQDSRKAFGVTVKIDILAKPFRLPYLSRGEPISLFESFFLNLSLEVWTEFGKKAYDKDHALSGGISLVQVCVV